MSDFEEDMASSRADWTTVKGSMCKIFKAQHKPERVFHKSMGVIHPVHTFDDPRKKFQDIDLEPRTKDMTLFDFYLKYKEKSFLPEHLTHPFIYIDKVVPKEVTGYRTYYQHPDEWNKSINCDSKRRLTQVPKLELSELTRSIVKSKREKDDRNDYEQNERLKKYVRFFFSNIKQLLEEKRFQPEVAKELINPNSKLWQTKSSKDLKKNLTEKNKNAVNAEEGQNSSKNKKQDAGKQVVSKEFVVLDKNYSLKEIWKAYCIVKKIDFKGDDQQIIDLTTFKDFIKSLGYLEKKWSEIDKYYDYCNKKEDVGLVHPSEYDDQIHRGAESPKKENNDAVDNAGFGSSPLKTKDDFMKNSSLLQWRPARRKYDKSKFSMRAFVFNFNKFLQDSEKIPYVLSVRAATERRVGLKYYVQQYFHDYDVFKTRINGFRDLEEECQNVIKGIASEFDDDALKKEIKALNDLEDITKKGHRFSLEEKTKLDNDIAAQKEKIQVEMDKFNELFRIAHDKFQEICNEKDRLFYEKRIIIRFISPICVKKELLVMKSVEEIAADRIYAIQNERDIIEQFYENFLEEKDTYQEKAFKLFELANYIHENNFTKNELDIVSYFVKKVKGNYNVSRGQYKQEYLNPNQYISIDIFMKTFKIYKEKREHEIAIIDKIIEHFNDTLDKKMPRDTQERVKQKIEYNMMYDTFQKMFDELEQELETKYRKIGNVIQFILNNKEKIPEKFRNTMGYLIWGIYDQLDEYLPIEVREKIEKNPTNAKNPLGKKMILRQGNLADQSDKDEAIGQILGYNSGKNRSQDYELDFEDNKQFLKFKDQKFEQNNSEVQSEDEVLSPFQNKKKKNVKKSMEEDDEFAIEILNNKNNKQNKAAKLPFLNENDISGISDHQDHSQKHKRLI